MPRSNRVAKRQRDAIALRPKRAFRSHVTFIAVRVGRAALPRLQGLSLAHQSSDADRAENSTLRPVSSRSRALLLFVAFAACTVRRPIDGFTDDVEEIPI